MVTPLTQRFSIALIARSKQNFHLDLKQVHVNFEIFKTIMLIFVAVRVIKGVRISSTVRLLVNSGYLQIYTSLTIVAFVRLVSIRMFIQVFRLSFDLIRG